MSKNVTFYLGPAIGLASRLLTVTRMVQAGDDSTPSATITATLGSVTNSTQILPDNIMYQATLVDTKTTGEVAETDVLTSKLELCSFLGHEVTTVYRFIQWKICRLVRVQVVLRLVRVQVLVLLQVRPVRLVR